MLATRSAVVVEVVTPLLAQLFPVLPVGSVGPAPLSATQAVLVRAPLTVLTTGTAKATLAPTASGPALMQVRSNGPARGNPVLGVQVQPAVVTGARMVMPAGMLSVTVSVCPAATGTGPALRTLTVKL